MAIGKVNTGGGGAGGTLVVTGVAGDIITATKDGKTYSRTFNSAGKAVFRGLATGIWALTMTNGSQTVTRNVTITADYSLTMAYFTATIAVTWPAGSTCTCTNGSTVLTAPDTSGSYTFTVTNTGTWTVSCTDGDKTKSASVSITTEGQTESVGLNYELVFFKSGLGMVTPLTVNKWNNNAGILNITNEHIQWSYQGNSQVEISIYGTSTVDLSKYNNVHMTIGAYHGAINDFRDRPHLYVSNNIVTGQEGVGGAGMAAYTEADAAGTWTLDIAKFNANMYVGVWGGWNGTITRLWLD